MGRQVKKRDQACNVTNTNIVAECTILASGDHTDIEAQAYVRPRFNIVVKEFSDLLSIHLGSIHLYSVSTAATHHINTVGPQANFPPRSVMMGLPFVTTYQDDVLLYSPDWSTNRLPGTCFLCRRNDSRQQQGSGSPRLAQAQRCNSRALHRLCILLLKIDLALRRHCKTPPLVDTKRYQYRWTEECEQAFRNLKTKLTVARILAYPRGKPIGPPNRCQPGRIGCHPRAEWLSDSLQPVESYQCPKSTTESVAYLGGGGGGAQGARAPPSVSRMNTIKKDN